MCVCFLIFAFPYFLILYKANVFKGKSKKNEVAFEDSTSYSPFDEQ